MSSPASQPLICSASSTTDPSISQKPVTGLQTPKRPTAAKLPTALNSLTVSPKTVPPPKPPRKGKPPVLQITAPPPPVPALRQPGTPTRPPPSPPVDYWTPPPPSPPVDYWTPPPPPSPPVDYWSPAPDQPPSAKFFPPLIPSDPFIGSPLVYQLDRGTFGPFLKERDVAFVLFYNPEDPSSCYPMKNFKKASIVTTRENHVYATVNCEKDGDLCLQEIANTRVTKPGIPFLRLYSKGYTVGTIRNVLDGDWKILKTFVERCPVFEDQTRPLSICNSTDKTT